MRLELDPRATALRFSLLTALGLLPLSCGGNASGTGPAPCSSPQVNADSGLVACGEGYSHRPAVTTCGGDAEAQRALPYVNGTVDCSQDASVCAQFRFGFCQGGQGGLLCASGCAVDSDCGADRTICVCGDPSGFGTCQYSTCYSDADCGDGLLCASYSAGCGGGFACQTERDTCATGEDCAAGLSCQPGADGSRSCGPTAACGRPFLVDAQARVAPVVGNDAWRDLPCVTPRVDHLSLEQRAEHAEHWAHLGQLEHASIAAFARFNLQLLSLGAPPELVEACTRALADETAHTKLCFALASAYAGRAIGPGPLQVHDSLQASSLEDILELVIAEGCFGETGAALDALRCADEAEDPVIRAAYAQIAADEERHAELAFRFVRWALRHDYPTARRRVMAALTHASCTGPAVDGVVAPCLEALLFADEAA